MTIAEVVIHYVYLQGATEVWVREMSIRTKVQGGRFCLVFGWIDTLFTIVFRTRLVNCFPRCVLPDVSLAALLVSNSLRGHWFAHSLFNFCRGHALSYAMSSYLVGNNVLPFTQRHFGRCRVGFLVVVCPTV